MALRTLILDFDGTCTDVPATHQRFLDETFRVYSAAYPMVTLERWERALTAVRAAAPDAAWMLAKVPAAPSGADPYVLAGEAISFLNREDGRRDPQPDFFTEPYKLAEAPFRPELVSVLEAADAMDLAIHFISNSDTKKIAGRLDSLLADKPALRAKIKVEGNAAKFSVMELPWDQTFPQWLRQRFERLPAEAARRLSRPIYLRRGSYMRALGTVWGDDDYGPSSTLVCGDIWELDLALPDALGCAVHLIERAPPYFTYAYELDAMTAARRGSSSYDLNGLLARLRRELASS
ncbi:MAG: hypothetical protein JST92_18320 [Deltaproteobacteria bacterium]|nr:hypothetical protein [Deltaproteobacteria bacterium]